LTFLSIFCLDFREQVRPLGAGAQCRLTSAGLESVRLQDTLERLCSVLARASGQRGCIVYRGWHIYTLRVKKTQMDEDSALAIAIATIVASIFICVCVSYFRRVEYDDHLPLE